MLCSPFVSAQGEGGRFAHASSPYLGHKLRVKGMLCSPFVSAQGEGGRFAHASSPYLGHKLRVKGMLCSPFVSAQGEGGRFAHASSPYLGHKLRSGSFGRDDPGYFLVQVDCFVVHGVEVEYDGPSLAGIDY